MMRLGNAWLYVLCLATACGDGRSSDEASEGETGDGDGDPTGDGDGDGDGESGDGDGEPTGDGDGEPTGDGDGEPTTGDGDGDACANPDQDGDNHEDRACGGQDCNDEDPNINPDAPDFTLAHELVADGLPVGLGQTPLNIGLDAQGVIHIGWAHNGDMMHAWREGGRWQTEPLDTGIYPTILPRSDGVIEAVSIQSIGAAALRHGVYDGGMPVLTFPDPLLPISVNAGHSFALGPNDTPHIAHSHDQPEDLRYATRVGNNWVPELIDPEGGRFAALALGPDGEPHVFYSSAETFVIRHAVRTQDGWDITDVEQIGSTLIPTLAVRSDGVAFAAWRDLDGPNLIVANNEGGSWAQEEIPETSLAAYSDIAFGPGGEIYVVVERYTNAFASSLALLYQQDGAWQQRELAPVDSRGGTITIDSDGWVHIAYANLTQLEVRYVGMPVADAIDDDCDGDHW